MKNNVVRILAIVLLLAPQVTFATWWNPSTWGAKNATQEKAVQKTIVTPPVPPTPPKKEVAIPKVQKKTTPIAGTQKKVTSPVKKIVVPAKKKETKTTTNPLPKTSNNALQPKPDPKPQPVSTTINIKEKVSNVVQIVCPVNGGSSSGTGSIIYGVSNVDSLILTNKHVLAGATGPCGIYRTQSYENSPVIYFKSGNTFIFSKENDLAILTPDVNNLTIYPNTNFQFNQNTEVFDKGIWVLGYPPSAGNNITLTKGVVSGSENVNGVVMYKTDAKIDNGNSGGVVFDEAGKFMGVPTLASQGNYSSYGYIIPAQTVKTFLDLVIQEGYGKQNWQHPQLSLYRVNPSNTVPDVAPRVPQNPAPKVQEDPSLKIAKCQAEKDASDKNFEALMSKALDEKLAEILKDRKKSFSIGIPDEDLAKLTPSAVGEILRRQTESLENENAQYAKSKRDALRDGIAKNDLITQQDYIKCLNK